MLKSATPTDRPAARGRTRGLLAVALVLLALCLALAASAFAYSSASGGGWLQQNSGTTADLYDVDFVDATHGWAVGTSGTILVTSDGGSTWSPQVSPVTKTLVSVTFADLQHGWVLTTGGVTTQQTAEIYATKDGGSSWSRQSTLPSMAFSGSIQAIDADHCWAVGAYVYATSNGGATWSRQTTPSPRYLFRCCFVDSSHGWAAGSEGAVVSTSDGGITWGEQTSGSSTYLEAVTFVDPVHGWMASADRSVLSTSDGGANWVKQNSGATSQLVDLSFADVTHGWTISGSEVIATSNGGATWGRQGASGASDLRAVHFVDAKHGWIVGSKGLILATSDGGGVIASPSPTPSPTPTGPTPGRPSGWLPQSSGTNVALNAVSHDVVVGSAGTVLVRRGNSWSIVNSGTTTDLYDIAISPWGLGFAVGGGTPTYAKAAGVILATKDRGATWTPQSVVFGSDFGPVWDRLTSVAVFQESPEQVGYLSEPLGWAVGVYDEQVELGGPESSAVFQTLQDTSYADWTYGKAQRFMHFRAIAFPDAYHGWLVGDRQGHGVFIFATTDGGDSWVEQSLGRGATYLLDVAFADAAHSWVVGSGGTILATTTGGAFWGTQNSGTTANLNAVAFTDASHGWAVGDYGTILATTNGGATWTAQNSVKGANLQGVDFTSSTSGLAVGSGGTILATTTGGFPPPAPSITGIKPASAKRGALVTITGTEFGVAQGTSSVRFGSASCTKYVSWSDMQIKCKVPAKAKFGAVAVTVTTTNGASNAMSFTVKR